MLLTLEGIQLVPISCKLVMHMPCCMLFVLGKRRKIRRRLSSRKSKQRRKRFAFIKTVDIIYYYVVYIIHIKTECTQSNHLKQYFQSSYMLLLISSCMALSPIIAEKGTDGQGQVSGVFLQASKGKQGYFLSNCTYMICTC